MLGPCYCVLDAEYWRDLSAEDNMLITTSGGMILPGPGACTERKCVPVSVQRLAQEGH